MSAEFKALVACFDKALERKKAGKFDKNDVKAIFNAAKELFHDQRFVDDEKLHVIMEKWVALADGHLDKGGAQKKLHGTSRAEAIQSVLLSTF